MGGGGVTAVLGPMMSPWGGLRQPLGSVPPPAVSARGSLSTAPIPFLVRPPAVVMGPARLWGWLGYGAGPSSPTYSQGMGGRMGGLHPAGSPCPPPPPRAASIPCSVGRTPVVPHRRCPPGRSGDAVLFGGGRCPQTPFLTHSSTRGRYPWGKGGSGGRCSSLTASAPPEEHSYGVQPPPQHPPPRIYRG